MLLNLPGELQELIFQFFHRPGGLQEAFLALSVADRLPHTFPEAFAAHFGCHFGFKKDYCFIVCLVPSGLFSQSFVARCLLRVFSEIRSLRALREKGAYGLRPTKTNGFLRFVHVRDAAGRAARKAKRTTKYCKFAWKPMPKII